MWIMIAGAYSSGTRTDAEREDNRAALAVFERGHTPIIGVNLALPIVQIAGAERFDELMMPISLAASQRCDACLRIGGPSTGADQEVQAFRDRGLPVDFALDDVPDDSRA